MADQDWIISRNEALAVVVHLFVGGFISSKDLKRATDHLDGRNVGEMHDSQRDRLRAERDEWERRYREERDARCKGGANLRVNHNEWSNTAIATPEAGAPLPELKTPTKED